MTNVQRLCMCGGLAFAVVFGVQAHSAHAIMTFWKEFEERYVKPDSEDPAEQAFAKLASAKNKETGKCNVCHIKGKSKKYHNTYGKALAEFLDKDDFKTKRRKEEPEAVKKEIQEAFDKAAKMHSDPDNKESPLFGKLMEEGKLPGLVRPKDLKKPEDK